MPSPLDWLNVNPTPQTNLMVAPIPARQYGLTAQDAVMQGRQNLPKIQAAATYADLLRQQALAPLQQQVTQMQLQNQLQVQPQINSGRDQMIAALADLDPNSEDYLAKRRDAIMQNPYGVADPVVQHVLQANDRAYDDYINTRRLNMYGDTRPLSPSQRLSTMSDLRKVNADLSRATAMQDQAQITLLTQQKAILEGMLNNDSPGSASEAVVNAAPSAPGTDIMGMITPNGEQLSDPENWTLNKERVLDAVVKEAGPGKVDQLILNLRKNPEVARVFFEKYFSVKPGDTAFKKKTGSFYSTNVSWDDVVEALQADQDLLQQVGTSPAAASGLSRNFERNVDAEDGIKPGTWKIELE